jgi:hypothetical protein
MRLLRDVGRTQSSMEKHKDAQIKAKSTVVSGSMANSTEMVTTEQMGKATRVSLKTILSTEWVAKIFLMVPGTMDSGKMENPTVSGLPSNSEQIKHTKVSSLKVKNKVKELKKYLGSSSKMAFGPMIN